MAAMAMGSRAIFHSTWHLNSKRFSNSRAPLSLITSSCCKNKKNVAELKRGLTTVNASATTQAESLQALAQVPSDTRIPSPTLAGLLGSGKDGKVVIGGSLVACQMTGAEDIVRSSNSWLCCTGVHLVMVSELVRAKIVKSDHIIIETTDQECFLEGVIRLEGIKCFDPVVAEKHFIECLEKCGHGGFKVLTSCNEHTQVHTKSADAWLPQSKSPKGAVTTLEPLKGIQFVASIGRRKFPSWVCFAGGPRPRNPRVWKARTKIGTVSKSEKLVEYVKRLSNVKEEVYGALDSFIAWEVEFPLIVIKKALRKLQAEKEWKRIIQISKWMLSKGQGKTMGTHYMLLNALANERRIEEAEELWMEIFNRHMEYVPRMFFTRIITMYERNNMTEKLLEVFADMEELGVTPERLAVVKIANTFKNMGMMDKYEKVFKKYPETEWEYRYRKGNRYRVLVPKSQDSGGNLIHQDDITPNVAKDDESTIHDFHTAEVTNQQYEVSQLLEEKENFIHQDDSTMNVAKYDESAIHDFHTVEVTKKQHEVSELLEDRENLIHQDDNTPNVAEDGVSTIHDFHAAEVRK